MSDLDKTTYLPSEMAEEIRGLKDWFTGTTGLIPAIEEKDVSFYDYDGTLLYSYSSEEFLKLDTMPDNPKHSGLIAQGWNWSLEDAKEYVSVYNELIIGQNYTTSDGATRLHITLDEEHLTPHLHFLVDKYENYYIHEDPLEPEYGSVTVDWGDGWGESFTRQVNNEVEDRAVEIEHTYEQPGEYVISLTPTDHSMIEFCTYGHTYPPFYYSRFLLSDPGEEYWEGSGSARTPWGNYYRNCLHEINFGNDVMINKGAIVAPWLESISLPVGISLPREDQLSGFVEYCMTTNYVLKCLIFPNSLTQITCNLIIDFASLKIISLPRSITKLGSCFADLPAVKKLCLPDRLTSLGNCVYGFRSLERLVIPESVETMAPIYVARYQEINKLNSTSFALLVFKTSRPPRIENGDGLWGIPRYSTISVEKGTLQQYLALAQDYSESQAESYPYMGRYNYTEHGAQMIYASVDYRGYPYYTPKAICLHGNGVWIENGTLCLAGSDVDVAALAQQDTVMAVFSEKETNNQGFS